MKKYVVVTPTLFIYTATSFDTIKEFKDSKLSERGFKLVDRALFNKHLRNLADPHKYPFVNMTFRA